MKTKFEKLIEYIVNDEDTKARALFHKIVVEKSRSIYESIMDEEVHGDQVDDLVDEVGYDEGGEDGDDFEDDADALDTDEEDFDAGEDEGDDKMMSIDSKLDELLAKFDEIMGDEEGADEYADDEEEFGASGVSGRSGASGEFGADEDEFADDDFDGEQEVHEDVLNQSGKSGKSGSAKSGKSGNPFPFNQSGKSGSAKSGKSGSEMMREYVDRIGDIYGGEGDASEGLAVGAAGKKTPINTKSGSVGPGANFGGKVVKTDTKQQNQDGKTPTKASNEYNKGQGQLKSGNVNVPGGKAAGKPKATGVEYSKERPSEGTPVGTGKKVAINKKSEIGGKVR